MKKIGKIIINPEKVIKNEELVNLRGGYGGGYNDYPCTCTCFNAEAFADNPDDPVECYGYVFQIAIVYQIVQPFTVFKHQVNAEIISFVPKLYSRGGNSIPPLITK